MGFPFRLPPPRSAVPLRGSGSGFPEPLQVCGVSVPEERPGSVRHLPNARGQPADKPNPTQPSEGGGAGLRIKAESEERGVSLLEAEPETYACALCERTRAFLHRKRK